MNTQQPRDISPEHIREQVLRIQGFLYEFIKGLSKLKQDQNTFLDNMGEQNSMAK